MVIWYQLLVKTLLLGTLFLIAISSNAALNDCPAGTKYFCRPANHFINPHINIEQFYSIPAQIISLYSKDLAEAQFLLDLDWTSPYFGAGISLKDGNTTLMILGGTTRIEGLTKDAYAALVCHEIGHILGGAPLQELKGSQNLSKEGQADFFAASECLPRYFSHLGVQFDDLATRVEAAGWHMFKSMMPFSTSTMSQSLLREGVELPPVSRTTDSYPSLQCRYETFRSPSKRSSCWFAQ